MSAKNLQLYSVYEPHEGALTSTDRIGCISINALESDLKCHTWSWIGMTGTDYSFICLEIDSCNPNTIYYPTDQINCFIEFNYVLIIN